MKAYLYGLQTNGRFSSCYNCNWYYVKLTPDSERAFCADYWGQGEGKGAKQRAGVEGASTGNINSKQCKTHKNATKNK
jgi:hypothetical protein